MNQNFVEYLKRTARNQIEQEAYEFLLRNADQVPAWLSAGSGAAIAFLVVPFRANGPMRPDPGWTSKEALIELAVGGLRQFLAGAARQAVSEVYDRHFFTGR